MGGNRRTSANGLSTGSTHSHSSVSVCNDIVHNRFARILQHHADIEEIKDIKEAARGQQINQ
jgi:hypothetical protein